MRAIFLFVLGIAICAGTGVASAQAVNGVLGRWQTQDGKGVIAIAQCGNSICGYIDWLDEPSRNGQPAHDIHNPDPTLRQRLICGLPIMYGFHHDAGDPRRWTEGYIYDPESGDTYHAQVTAQDANHIQLRGYIGIPLFGETQTWARADAKHPPCRVNGGVAKG